MEEAGEAGFDELSNETIRARYREYRAQSGATQSKGVTEQGVGMAPCDLIRNYVHEHFEGEAEQRRVYEQRWLPMERGCCAAAGVGVEVAAAVARAVERTVHAVEACISTRRLDERHAAADAGRAADHRVADASTPRRRQPRARRRRRCVRQARTAAAGVA